MTIEEMKAKGYTRYTAFIKKLIITKEVEVWAKDWNDARDMLENAAKELLDSTFENVDDPEVICLEHDEESLRIIATAQSTVTDFNEDFYKSEEE